MGKLIEFYCGRCYSNFYIKLEDEKDVGYCPFCKNTEIVVNK